MKTANTKQLILKYRAANFRYSFVIFIFFLVTDCSSKSAENESDPYIATNKIPRYFQDVPNTWD